MGVAGGVFANISPSSKLSAQIFKGQDDLKDLKI